MNDFSDPPILDLSFNLITSPELPIDTLILANGLIGDLWKAKVVKDNYAVDLSNRMGFSINYNKSHWVCSCLINIQSLHKLELYS